jgi:hypothetical protein
MHIGRVSFPTCSPDETLLRHSQAGECFAAVAHGINQQYSELPGLLPSWIVEIEMFSGQSMLLLLDAEYQDGETPFRQASFSNRNHGKRDSK